MDRAGDMMVIGAVSAYNDAAHSRLGLDFLSGILQAYKVEFDRPAWMRHLWAVSI